ncbi:MAG: NAD(P)H-hydrate epimerase [Planctomycetota bacterium]
MGAERTRSATRSEIRRIDELAIAKYGVPGIALMENAGAGATRFFRERFECCRKAIVVCGKGNNGGDGLVIARHLAYAGVAVRIVLVSRREDVKGDAGVNLEIVDRMKLAIATGRDAEQIERELSGIEGRTLVVDAVLGTGATGEVRGPARKAIELINATGCPVAAVDIPSGMDADTGEPMGCVVRATVTATMGLRKKGFDRPGARAYTGEVAVIEIGWPVNAVEEVLGPGGSP